MSAEELKACLSSLGTSPKKSLSQNFLIDEAIIFKIIEAAAVTAKDAILEVGPGTGALTRAIIDKGADLVAIELDPIFAQVLNTLPVTVYQGDILTFSFEKCAFSHKRKVISNLPYHLTTPILIRLMSRGDLFSTLTLVVQEEVARRITACPGMPAYGLLTLFVNFYSSAHYAFPVSCNCFCPSPKVDSAVVVLTLKEPSLADSGPFFSFIQTLFRQRRKMIRNSLSSTYEPESMAYAFKNLGIDFKARPQELTLDVFLALYKSLTLS